MVSVFNQSGVPLILLSKGDLEASYHELMSQEDTQFYLLNKLVNRAHRQKSL